MSLMKVFFALALLIPASSMAASVECTAKRLDQVAGEYQEEKLKIGNDSNGIYTASLTLKDCFFSAQSANPEIFRLTVSHVSSDISVSNYGGFDNKGHIISTYSKDKAQFICMLVCSKTAPR